MDEDIHTSLRQLLRVSEIDGRIDALKKEREGLAEQLGIHKVENRLDKVIADRRDLEELVRKLRSQVRLKEAECRELEREAAGIRKKLFEGKVKSPKEMNAMERKAGSLDVRREERETEVLEQMVELDELNARLDRALAAEQETRALLEDRQSQVQEREKEIDHRLEELAQLREPEWESVPENLQREYEYRRSRGRRGQIVSAMKAGRCTACRVMISIVVANKVERGEGLFNCENCGRLLCWVNDE